MAPARIGFGPAAPTARTSRELYIRNGQIAMRESIPQNTIQSLTLAHPGTGIELLTGVACVAGDSFTKVGFVAGSTALTMGSNVDGHLWFSVRDPAGGLLAQTADQGGAATWAASTAKSVALQSTVTIPTDGFYYVGLMIAIGTGGVPALPTLMGRSGFSAVANGTLFTGQLKLAGTAGSGLGAVAPNTATIAGTAVLPYCALIP